MAALCLLIDFEWGPSGVPAARRVEATARTARLPRNGPRPPRFHAVRAARRPAATLGRRGRAPVGEAAAQAGTPAPKTEWEFERPPASAGIGGQKGSGGLRSATEAIQPGATPH
jgi:hypothetical protein